jgi:regulator of replication initiation timing
VNELEEAFKELRDANSKYSIEVLKLQAQLAEKDKAIAELNTDWCKCASLNAQLNIENRKLQAQLAEKESIIEQMVDVSIVTKLNEEIAEKDKEIEQAVTLLINASNQLAYVNHYECDGIDEFINKHYKQKDEVK